MSVEINMQDQMIEYFEETDQSYEAYAKSKGLTYITLTILEAIYEMPGECTQKRIVETTRYPKQTVNLVVKSFVENGYLELKEIPTDHRNKSIHFTEAGKRYAENIVAPLVAAEARAMEKLGTEKVEMLLRLLKEYCDLYCEGLDEL